MRDFLKFPEKFSVSVNLDFESYLKKANLSAAGEKRLRQYVDELELLYLIKLQDGTEFPVYRVGIINGCLDRDEIGSVKLIAESMPYDCIIVAQKAQGVRFYFFDRRDNPRDPGRSCIDAVHKTRTMVVGKETRTSSELLPAIRGAIAASKTRDVFLDLLKGIRDRNWKSEREEQVKNLYEIMGYDIFWEDLLAD